MASGDTYAVFVAQDAFGPSSDFAIPDLAATTLIPVLDFDDSTTKTAYFLGVMPGTYDGSSGLTVTLGWKFTTPGSSQTCDWEVSFYRVADDADSVAAYTFAAAQTVLATEAGTSGELDYADVTFTNAQADGIQPNEMFILRVVRDATGGTASPGDAELFFAEVEET